MTVAAGVSEGRGGWVCDGAARALPTCKDPDVGRTMQAVGARVTEWPLLRRVCAAALCPLALPTWPITRLDPAHAVNVPLEADGVQELAERDAGRGQLVHRQFRALAGTGQREEPIGRAGRRIDGPPGLGRKRLACRGCDAGGPGVAILNHVWPQSPATARALSSLARTDAISRRPNPCPLADCAHGASCSCASP